MILGENSEFPILHTAMSEGEGRGRYPIVHAILSTKEFNNGQKRLVISFDVFASAGNEVLVKQYKDEIVHTILEEYKHDSFVFEYEKGEYSVPVKLLGNKTSMAPLLDKNYNIAKTI